jgi:hypothetical protein
MKWGIAKININCFILIEELIFNKRSYICFVSQKKVFKFSKVFKSNYGNWNLFTISTLILLVIRYKSYELIKRVFLLIGSVFKSSLLSQNLID